MVVGLHRLLILKNLLPKTVKIVGESLVQKLEVQSGPCKAAHCSTQRLVQTDRVDFTHSCAELSLLVATL